MEDEEYFQSCTAAVRKTRAWTVEKLEGMGFTVLPSSANFVFAKSDRMVGGELYRRLKELGILVRHFDAPQRIADYCRITIGSGGQMAELVMAIGNLLNES